MHGLYTRATDARHTVGVAASSSLRWGVGVSQSPVLIVFRRGSRARVFLGTLDPGYTHGNRPHVCASTFLSLSLSPLSPFALLLPPVLRPHAPHVSPARASERGGAFILPHGGFGQSSKSIRRLSVLTLRTIPLDFLVLSLCGTFKKSSKVRSRSAKFEKKSGSL